MSFVDAMTSRSISCCGSLALLPRPTTTGGPAGPRPVVDNWRMPSCWR
jgi:hypothetical protein